MEQTRTRLDRSAMAYVKSQGGLFKNKTLTVHLQTTRPFSYGERIHLFPSGNDIFLENLQQGIKFIIGGKDSGYYP